MSDTTSGNTLQSFEDLKICSEARRKARFDFYYGKEMSKLQEEWVEKQKNRNSEKFIREEYYCSFKPKSYEETKEARE